jgi:hypothetical protein
MTSLTISLPEAPREFFDSQPQSSGCRMASDDNCEGF